MSIRRFITFSMIFAVFSTDADAQDLGSVSRLLRIDYDSLSGFSLGDGIDYEQLYAPAGNCIDLATSKISKDTPGSIEIKADVEVISTLEDLESSLSKSLVVAVGANGGMGNAFSADLATSMSETYEWFASQSSSSFIVRVRLYADYGRDVLDYVIKTNEANLLKGDEAEKREFVDMCGTHFIRAVQKEASLTVDLRVSNLSRDEKETLTSTANTTLKGSGTFSNGLNIGGDATVNEKLVSFERFASQFGSLDLSVYASGAPGFKGIGNTIFLDDSAKPSIQNYLNRLASLAENFDNSDGAPSKYLVVKYPGLPDSYVDYPKYLRIEHLVRSYLEVSQFDELYRQILRDDNDFYSRHFEEAHASVSSQIDLLKSLLADCVEDSECSGRVPSAFDYPNLENLLATREFEGECAYYTPVSDGVRSGNAMSDFALVWRGWINYPNHVQLNSISAFRVSNSGVVTNLAKFRDDRDFTVDPVVLDTPENPNDDPKGPGRAISQIVNERIPRNVIVKDGEVNAEALAQLRSDLASSIFGFRFRYESGAEFTQLIGKPDMSFCDLVR